MEPVKTSYFDSIPYPRISVPFVTPNLCALNQSNTSTANVPLPIANNNMTASNNYSGGQYTHHLIMDMDGKYHLFWRYDETNVTFEVQVEAHGWVGLGFSPNGGMAGADIVHAYIDNNGAPQLSVRQFTFLKRYLLLIETHVYFQDRFAVQAGFPVEDNSQDYMLLGGKKNNTHITISFTRKQFTCDEQDMSLTVIIQYN